MHRRVLPANRNRSFLDISEDDKGTSRRIKQTKVVTAACLAILFAVSHSSCSRKINPSQENTRQESGEPSREDLIEVVRKYVANKTYTESVAATRSVPKTERQPHTCTQYDV